MSSASFRAADRARIAEIAQILSLKDLIHALEAEKMRAQQRLDSYTYPGLTLPNEITSEIFTKFIPDYPSPPQLVGRGASRLRALRLVLYLVGRVNLTLEPFHSRLDR
ncbi:hypothetical protein C8R45DRAFT_1111924 [Mycena sanguinolenta]|nr:hypothetical protein C8R45DRAFT_1111924 [Mycena sanguinolenta]